MFRTDDRLYEQTNVCRKCVCPPVNGCISAVSCSYNRSSESSVFSEDTTSNPAISTDSECVLFYPEGAVGNIDVAPGDDDGVFDGFGGNVNAEEGAVSIICGLDVEGETLCILKAQTHSSEGKMLLRHNFTVQMVSCPVKSTYPHVLNACDELKDDGKILLLLKLNKPFTVSQSWKQAVFLRYVVLTRHRCTLNQPVYSAVCNSI